MRKFLSVSLPERRKLVELQAKQEKQRRDEYERESKGEQHAPLKRDHIRSAEQQELERQREDKAPQSAGYRQSRNLNPCATGKCGELS